MSDEESETPTEQQEDDQAGESMLVTAEDAARSSVLPLPWGIVLRNSAVNYMRTETGGMFLQFCPVLDTPTGRAAMPPDVQVYFSSDEWERFKREVAADGEKAPAIVRPVPRMDVPRGRR